MTRIRDRKVSELSSCPLVFLLTSTHPTAITMLYTNIWKRFLPRQLNIAIPTFSLISIFCEGYDQGVMGGVNASPYYVTEVDIGLPNGTVTKTTTPGGIVSI